MVVAVWKDKHSVVSIPGREMVLRAEGSEGKLSTSQELHGFTMHGLA